MQMIFWMIVLVATGIVLAGFTVWAARYWQIGADHVKDTLKFHRHWVPRLGGVSVFVTFILGCLLWGHLGYLSAYAVFALVACSLPTFLVGLAEDLTQKTGVSARLVVTMLSAAIAWVFLDGQIRRLDMPLIDDLLLQFGLFSFVLTAVAVAGVAHAVNIIDGCNGLCGFFAVFAFSAIAAVAALNNDGPLTQVSIIAALSMVGFLFWNYPMGRLFLGDAGAYFVGFLIAEFSILLVTRNPGVSPWCALLIVIYPVWETLFTMYRRAVGGGLAQMGRADTLHLHHLVYRRLVKSSACNGSHRSQVLRNAMTTPYLLVLVLLSIGPAVVFSTQPALLVGFCLLFAVSYLLFYRMIVRLGVPRWLVARGLANRLLVSRTAAGLSSP